LKRKKVLRAVLAPPSEDRTLAATSKLPASGLSEESELHECRKRFLNAKTSSENANKISRAMDDPNFSSLDPEVQTKIREKWIQSIMDD